MTTAVTVSIVTLAFWKCANIKGCFKMLAFGPRKPKQV